MTRVIERREKSLWRKEAEQSDRFFVCQSRQTENLSLAFLRAELLPSIARSLRIREHSPSTDSRVVSPQSARHRGVLCATPWEVCDSIRLL